MNWLDILLGVTLLVSLIGAVRNGLTREVVRLVALAVGIVGGMWWYDELAAYYQPYIADERAAAFAAFMSILVGSLLAGIVVSWALGKILHWTGLRWFDRLLGAPFGLLRGLLICAALVLAIVSFAPISGSAKAVADSRLAPWVLYGAQAAIKAAPGELKQAFSSGFERVRAEWIEAPPQSRAGAKD